VPRSVRTTTKLHVLLIEERQDTIVDEIGRRDRRLAVVEFGEGQLRIGVNEGLLVDTPDAFILPT